MCECSTVTEWEPWVTAGATLLAVVLGYALSRIPAHFDRRKKATGYLRGINSEIEYAAKHARIYVEGDPQYGQIYTPAYRLLTRFAIEGTPWLAGEGFLTRRDIEAVLAHLAAAEEFNRCLDEIAERAGEIRRQAKADGVDDIGLDRAVTDRLSRTDAVNRAGVKARNICTGEPARGTANDAQSAISGAADRASLSLAT